jgi:hypothetical protein
MPHTATPSALAMAAPMMSAISTSATPERNRTSPLVGGMTRTRDVRSTIWTARRRARRPARLEGPTSVAVAAPIAVGPAPGSRGWTRPACLAEPPAPVVLPAPAGRPAVAPPPATPAPPGPVRPAGLAPTSCGHAAGPADSGLPGLAGPFSFPFALRPGSPRPPLGAARDGAAGRTGRLAGWAAGAPHGEMEGSRSLTAPAPTTRGGAWQAGPAPTTDSTDLRAKAATWPRPRRSYKTGHRS